MSETKTLLKTLEGIDIFIDNETGQFSAKVGGRSIKKRSLRDVEKEIEKTAGAVVAYEVGYYQKNPHKVEILGFEKGRARIKEDGRLARYNDHFYIMDEATRAKLIELKKKIEELEQLWTEELNSLNQVTDRNFSDIRKSQSQV